MKNSTFGNIEIIIASMLLGTLPFLTMMGYRGGATALTILSLRFLSASAIVWLYIWVKKIKVEVTIKQLIYFALAAIFGMGIMAFSYFSSFRYIPSSMSAMILFTYPVIVTYLSAIFLKQPLTKVKMVALGLVVGGGFLMTGGDITFHPLGIFLAITTTVLYAFYIFFLGSPLTYGQDPKILNAFIFLFAGIFCTILGALRGELTFDLEPTAWIGIITMSIVATVFALLLFSSGVRKVGSSVASILGNIEPITAFLLGLVILRERATLNQWVGAFLILLGVLYVQLAQTKKEQVRDIVLTSDNIQ